ncbi:MAG: NAD(P)-binding protein [Bacteroidota bacterium]
MQLKTDYLIVGSGAVGMAFADVLLTETDADLIIVDKHHKPGGHWNVAYPFVTLHQPSAFYGVSSLELSKGRKDEVGWNKGLNGLATGAEVSAYFDEVMRHQFLPSGRVRYFPMCNYQGDGKFVSMLTGEGYEVEVNKKTVDATFLNTSVPSTHTPNFTIAEGVQFMPINDLPKITAPPAGFVIIGGGKTGIDACLWLLENKVDPDKITWIVSRDAWLLDRKNTQPTIEFFYDSIGAQAAKFEAVAAADSIEDMFNRLEAAGVLVRIDQTVRPKMFHGATISMMELEQLRRIKNVVRLGRVQQLDTDQIVLEQGTIPTSTAQVHVDCSASAITNLEMKPIFQGDLITPQTVRSYQPVFSAAFIAHVEASYAGDAQKNALCCVVPLPNHDTDWIRMLAAMMMNQFNWSQDKGLRKWLVNNRLDGFSKMVRSIPREDTEKRAVIQRMRDAGFPAMIKLKQFLEELDAKGTH